MDLDLARRLARPAETKIVLLVLDGLGGLAHPQTRRTELQTARTPHLDRLAAQSDLGLTVPVAPGVTPGSGPGHLALFGYDPLIFEVGRGVLEAIGIDFALVPEDVAVRGNFCTLARDDAITDRRAGRIATKCAQKLVERLRTIDVGPAIEVFVEPVREHRFVLVLRGPGLDARVSETDPQRLGVAPLSSEPLHPSALATAQAINQFCDEARRQLADAAPANGLLLRGIAKLPQLPQLEDVWKIQAASAAIYPMYRGLARLAGMTALGRPASFDEQVTALRQHWDAYDYLFVHYKSTDTAGEDGDFDAKVAAIEELDRQLPVLLDLEPDVLGVAGDHATPAILAAHSWHSVPFLLHSPYTRPDPHATFDELSCAHGSLGTFPAAAVMPFLMAHAGRLSKYGA